MRDLHRYALLSLIRLRTAAGKVRAVAAISADSQEVAGSGARALRHVGASCHAARGDVHRGHAPDSAADQAQWFPCCEGHCRRTSAQLCSAHYHTSGARPNGLARLNLQCEGHTPCKNPSRMPPHALH